MKGHDVKATRQPALVFVDRDGTLVEEVGYLADTSRVRLLPGAAEAILRLNQAGIAVALVTNQSGIGRGLFTLEQYLSVHAEMERQLLGGGARLDAHVFCPDPPGGASGRRKPSPLMFQEAADSLGLSPHGAAFIGDQLRDIQAAEHFGGTGWLVQSGHPFTAAEAPPWSRCVPDLYDAVNMLLSHP